MAIGPSATRLSRVDTGFAVDPIERFGPVVIRGEILVAQLPIRGRPLLQREAAKLALAHALENAAPDLAVATQGIDRLGREGIPIGPKPLLTRVVAVLAEQVDVRDVLIRQGHHPTALQEQDALARGRQLPSDRAASSTAADHDDVVVNVVNDHGSWATARRRSVKRG